MVENLNELARSIISENQYCSIATTDSTGKPWNSVVTYAPDADWNFYFASTPNSRHSLNIEKNAHAVFAIFDSHQTWDGGVGLQIEAEIEAVSPAEFPNVAKIYATRKYPYGGNVFKAAMDFFEALILYGKSYKFYRITPTSVWMNDPNSNSDARVKIDLKAEK